MNLYGDLPPVGGSTATDADTKALVSQSGWSRPKIGQIPRSLAAAGTKSLSASAATFKPRATTGTTATTAITPTGAAVGMAGVPGFANRLAVPVVTVETVSQKRTIDGASKYSVTEFSQKNNQNNPQNNSQNNIQNHNNFISNSGHGASFDVEDPYDPSRPNDYLLWCEERLEKKRLDKLAEENKHKMAAAERARLDMEKERQEAMESGDVQRLQASMGASRGRGRGLNNLPAWMAQYSAPSSSSGDSASKGDSAFLSGDLTGQFDDRDREEGTAASRIMMKMGFQQGDGLGRDGQGILNALEHRNLGPGSTSHIIVDEQDRMRLASRTIAAKLAMTDPDFTSPPEEEKVVPKKRLGLFSNPSCVVLLKNMVGPGDVDDMLADECKQECSKYGPVSTCVIHEITTDPNCPEEECVRTFVCFEKQESAVRAYREMNGRFFGGRQIAATFYDEGKFNKKDLGPTPGEYTV